MIDSGTALVTGLFGSGAAVITAWALLVKAKGAVARPNQLLRRLWDWLGYAGLVDEVPQELAEEIRETILSGDEKR